MSDNALIFEETELQGLIHHAGVVLAADGFDRVEQAAQGLLSADIGVRRKDRLAHPHLAEVGRRVVFEDASCLGKRRVRHRQDVVVAINIGRRIAHRGRGVDHDLKGDVRGQRIDARQHDSLHVVVDIEGGFRRGEGDIDMTLGRNREQELLFGRVLDRNAGAVGDGVLVGIADAQLGADAGTFDAEL